MICCNMSWKPITLKKNHPNKKTQKPKQTQMEENTLVAEKLWHRDGLIKLHFKQRNMLTISPKSY